MAKNPAAIMSTLLAQGNALQTTPGVSPLVSGYGQWVAGRQIGPGLPRDMRTFLEGTFGPLTPIQPMPVDVPAEGEARPDPRRFQYPIGWNIPIGQPGSEGYKLAPFQTLRDLADRYSVVRAMLNIRKDELAGLQWDIGPTAEAQERIKGDKGAAKDARERGSQMVNWFKRNLDSNYSSFHNWFSACIEDVLVTDALSIHRLPTRVKGKGLFGSGLAEMELLAGETIRPLFNMRGARPRPPDPAYQQYLWGVPRTDMMTLMNADDLDEIEARAKEAGDEWDGDPESVFAADQLLYLPYTQRSWTPYGFPPVEQALVPIMLGLNRQAFLLDYFSEGTIPGAYIVAGAGYESPTMQRQLQDTLNSLAGDVAWKHRIIVLPPNSKSEPQKDLAWQRDVDQTIVELMGMILHIQPHEIGMVPGGRTSGLGGTGMIQQQAEAAEETRTVPFGNWFKATFFDPIIQRQFGQEDMEWKWLDFEAEKDMAQSAATEKSFLSMGQTTIDQTRIDRGEEPYGLPLTSRPFIIGGPTGIIPLDPEAAQALQAMAPEPPPPPPGLGGPPSDGTKPGETAGGGTGTPPGAEKPASGPDAGAQDTTNPETPPAPAVADADKLSVATLTKWRIKYKDAKLPQIAHDYLLRSYPDKDVEWALDPDIEWEYDPHVKLSDVNMARRPGGRDYEKVQKISESLKTGASMDPVVLVDMETAEPLGYRIADGWHRTLAAEDADWKDVPAFIGHGVPDKYRDTITGPMQSDSDSKKAQLAELSTLRRYAKKGGSVSAFSAAALSRGALAAFDEMAKVAGVDAAYAQVRAAIEKDISLTAPLATGLVPYDLAGQRRGYTENQPASGSNDLSAAPGIEVIGRERCSVCGEPLLTDRERELGVCSSDFHPTEDEVQALAGASKYSEDQPRDESGRWGAGGGPGVGEQVRALTGPGRGRTGEVTGRRDRRGNLDRTGAYHSVVFHNPGGIQHAGLYHRDDLEPSGAPRAPVTAMAKEDAPELLKAVEAELARRGVRDLTKGDDVQHGWEHVDEGERTRKGTRPADMGTGIAGVERDGKRYGVGVAKDKDGVFVHTHRARSDSYPDMDAIPTSVLEFIDETG